MNTEMTTVFDTISIKNFLQHFSHSFHPYPLNDDFLHRLPSFRLRGILLTFLTNFRTAFFFSEKSTLLSGLAGLVASLKQPDHNKTYRIAHMIFYIYSSIFCCKVFLYQLLKQVINILNLYQCMPFYLKNDY